MKNKFIYLSVLALAFASCEPEFENEINSSTYSAGDADFTSYVALGNSLTAGFMDGTVFRSGQQYSFPNILSQQFSLVGGGAFTQPSFEDDVNNLGGLLAGGTPIAATRMIINASVGGPQNIAGTPTIEVSNLQAKAYNNLGVPLAKSFHLLAPGYGNLAGVATGQANPYFVRHATSPTTTVLADAMSMNPTFFTNWIGSNDVLSYATNGGANSDGNSPAADHNQTGNTDPATYGGNDITNANVFASVYNTIVTTLTSNGAKGVVATIPSVTSIPYFTTVPYNPVKAEVINANPQGPLLVQLYQFLAVATNGRIAPLNTAEGTTNPILITDVELTDLGAQITTYANASGNPLLIQYATQLGALYGRARQATANDLVVLSASSVIGTSNASSTAPFDINGVTFPMANKWVLTSSEQTRVASATATFNNSIKTIAQATGIAVADMNQILAKLADYGTGVTTEDGQTYYANYFSLDRMNTTLFSLDGVHPNAKGYAVVANEIIKVINNYYGAHLPLVVPGTYPGATILATNN